MTPLATMFLFAATLLVRDSATGTASASAEVPIASAMNAQEVTLWIDGPAPPELQPEIVASKLRRGATLLHGHVTDRTSGAPLSDVLVAARGTSALTDSRGYFEMHVETDGDDLAGTDLVIERSGYKKHIIANTALLDGADTHFIIRLERGAGITGRDDSHKIWLHRDGGPHPHDAEGSGAPHDDGAGPQSARETVPPRLLSSVLNGDLVTPRTIVPEMIRVGFNCASANACASVEIMSLETYVKRGLNDEWIASWLPDSLRAGAVAYRSYGSYHVHHPRTPTYDICSTTSCQVNDADTSIAANAAVDDTRGIVLVRNGEIFRSEYSAENNNLLGERSCSNVDRRCGDGFAGSPSTGWPCLADPVCAGFSCFGHGRGMCQWGTQRWAQQGWDWRTIVNHYYGSGEGLRTSIITEPMLPPARRRAAGR